MSSQRTVALNVVARMEEYAADMRKMPGMTKEAAAKAALDMRKAFQREEQKRLRDFERNTKKQAQTYKKLMTAAMGAISVAAVIAAGRAVVSFAQNVANARNDINDLGNAIGQSNEQLQAFGFAARTSGGNLQQLAPSLKQFPKRLADMVRGTGEAKPAFDALGISAKEVADALENGVDITGKVIAKLQRVEAPTLKAAFATQIFGESGTRLLQVLGDKSLEDWIDITQRYAIDVGPEAVDATVRWEIASAMLEGALMKQGDALFRAVGGNDAFVRTGARVVGVVTTMVGLIDGFAQAAREANKRASILFATIALAASGDFAKAGRAWEKYKAAGVDTLSLIRQAFDDGKLARQDFLDDVDAIAAGGGRADAALTGLTDSIKKAGKAFKATRIDIKGVVDAQDMMADITLAAGDDLLDTAGKVAAGYRSTFGQIADALDDNLVTLEEAGEAYAALNARVERDITKAVAEEQAARLAETIGYIETLSAAFFTLVEAVADAHAEQKARALDTEVVALDKLKAKRKAALAEVRAAETAAEKARANDRLRRLTGEIKTQRAITKESRKAARDAAKAAKAVSIMTITLDGIVAGIKALATLGPIAGPIAAAAIAVTTGAALVAAATTPLPSFFRGGVRRTGGQVDSAGANLAVVHRDEAVLNAQGVRALGGADVVEAINQGFSGATMQSPTVILDGDAVAGAMAARIRRAGPVRSAARGAMRTGRRLQYRG